MWEYDAGEPFSRKKHGWAKDYAGVKKVRFGQKVLRVACCPKGISREHAQDILNTGLAYFNDEWDTHAANVHPDRIFCVHAGVPYEGRPTVRGRSFHAFPVLPERFPELPGSVREYLQRAADAQGRPIDEWLTRWKR